MLHFLDDPLYYYGREKLHRGGDGKAFMKISPFQSLSALGFYISVWAGFQFFLFCTIRDGVY